MSQSTVFVASPFNFLDFVKRNVENFCPDYHRLRGMLTDVRAKLAEFSAIMDAHPDLPEDAWDLIITNKIHFEEKALVYARELKRLRRNRRQVNSALIDLVRKGQVGLLHAHGARTYPLLRPQHVYVDKLVADIMKAYSRHNIRQENRRLAYVAEMYLRQFDNRFNLLEQEPVPEQDPWYEHLDAEVDPSSYVLSLKEQVKKVEYDFHNIDYSDYIPPLILTAKPRDPTLVKKLRNILSQLREYRLGRLRVPMDMLRRILFSSSNEPVEQAQEAIELEEFPVRDGQQFYDVELGAPATIELVAKVESQMERESKEGDIQSIQIDQKENVILTGHAEESRAEPVKIPVDGWENLCSSQTYQSYDIMQRWQRFATFEWSKDALNGTELYANILPRAFVLNYPDSPSCVLFKTYSYCKFDMEIKIQMNTNHFHCGQIQASFYYGATSDKFYKDRTNIFSASQMTNCVMDASSASEGFLYIPYRYYKPLLATRKSKDDADVLDLGNLRIYVLNKLRLPAGDTSRIDVTLFIRFIDPKFHGMISRDLGKIEAQMFSPSSAKSLVKGAENLLNTVFPDPRRDNPSNIVPSSFVTPINTHSWCVGDSLPEPINPLRLQATGVTPHPPGTIPVEPEMDIKYLVSVYGLVKQYNWTTSQQPGTILLSYPFSPVLRESDYESITVSNTQTRDCLALPPVSVMAECFAYWRGSLDYKIEFVSTQFHTGRLIVAYVPRLAYRTDLTLDQLTSCDHIILDIRENKQYQFINRFLSDKPWWPRRRYDTKTTESYPPGYIYVAVLNRLTATQSVSQDIEFNIYMRGAEDFELHIPVAPHLGLSSNTNVKEEFVESQTYISSYGPPQEQIYVGGWHAIVPSAGKKAALFRYGPGSDHVTQFPKPSRGVNTIYKIVGNPDDIVFISDNGTTVNARFLVIIPPIYALSTTKYYYGAAFNTYSWAKKFAESIKEDPTHEGFYTIDNSKLSICADDGPYSKRQDIIWWETFAPSSIEEEYCIIESQMEEERRQVLGQKVCIHPPIQSTDGGMYTFGEQIVSIKQLMRRYQPYSSFNLPSFKSDMTLADIIVPILPQGLNLQMASQYANVMRDGMIPILLSGYRFYRGGVRLRIVMSDNTRISSKHVWVQHKPNQNLKKLSIDVLPDPKSANWRFGSGYATYVQNMHTNSIIEIEVPFYLPVQFGLLQTPNLAIQEDAVHFSLGDLLIGLDYGSQTGTATPNCSGVIFYSVADDFCASVFQGFPLMWRPPLAVEAQSDVPKEENPGYFAKLKNSVQRKLVRSVINSSGDAVATELADAVQNNPDIKSFMDKFTDQFSQDQKNMAALALINVIHSIINPTFGTIAWSIVSFMVSLGFMAVSALNTAYKHLSKVVKKLFFRNKTDTGKGGVVIEQQAPVGDEDKCEAAFISTVVVGVLSLLGAKEKSLPTNIPDFAKMLYQGIPKFTLGANSLFTFFKNNLLMLKRVFYWCISWLRPETTLYAEIDSAGEEVLAFVKNVQWCLDARNEQTIFTSMAAQLVVYRTANIAMIIQAKMAVSSISKPMPVFSRLITKIIELRDKLAREYSSPPVRYEPFVIGLDGPTKIGKSHMISNLGIDMLKAIGFTTRAEPIYTRTPGNAYWNGLASQPICVFDDFLCLQDSTFGPMQIAELFALKTTQVYNPPKAAIEEKNIRYNPLVVITCSNVAHPNVPGVADNKAFWRRRDVLVSVEPKEEYKGKDPRQLEKSITKDYGHLQFQFYVDPTENKKVPKKYDYGEFKAEVLKRFRNYHESECEEYSKRLRQLMALQPTMIDTTLPVKDSLERMEKVMVSEFSKQMALSTAHMGPNPDPIHKMIEEAKSKFVAKPGEEYNAEKCLKEEPKKFKTKFEKIADYLRVCTAKEAAKVVTLADKTDNIVPNPPPIPSAPLEEITVAQVHDPPTEKTEAQAPDECKYVLTCKCRFCIVSSLPFMSCKNEAIGTDLDNDTCFKVGDCSPVCVLKSNPEKYAKWFVDKCTAKCPALRTECLPEHILVAAGLRVKVKDVMESVVEELNITDDRKWYQKLWDGIPGFGTILSVLLKVVALLGSIWIIISLFTSLFNVGDKVKCNSNNAGADLQHSEAVLYDSKEVNKTIKKLWTDEREYMEDSVKQMFTSPKQDQMPASGTSATSAKPKGNPAPIKAFAAAQAECAIHSCVRERIRRNTFWLYVASPDGSTSLVLRCLGLANRHFILLDHYDNYIQEKLKEGYSVTYITANTCIVLDYGSLRIHKSRGSALYVGTLPTKFSCFRDIIKFIAPSRYHNNLGLTAQLVEPVYNMSKNSVELTLTGFPRIGYMEYLGVDNDDGSRTVVDRVYTYSKSARGLCGSVLISMDNTSNPIIGIHIAGIRNGISGYAEAITRETFECFTGICQSGNVDAQMGDYDPKILPLTNVEILGTVGPELESVPPFKTRLVHTECYEEFFPSTYDAPVLSPKDERISDAPYSPLLEGINNHGLPPLDFPMQEMENAYEDLKEKILTNVVPKRLDVGVLTEEQSICGIHELPSYDPLDMKTSEGFPFTNYRPKNATNKRWMFDLSECKDGYVLNDIVPELKAVLKEKQDLRSQGLIPDTIFTACLKDAKLPKSKVLIPGKTRIFSISPVDFTIQQRQYFMDFSVAYQEARFDAEHAIGIDIKGEETSDLVRRLLQRGGHLLTGDYSKFGDTLMARCVYYVYKIIVLWYIHNGDDDPVNAGIRMVFCEEVMHAKILALNIIYQCYCGMPSGNPLTVVINSMVNSLYTRIIWQLIMKREKREFYPLSVFEAKVFKCFYGDDLIMSVSEDVLEYYNVQTMSDMFAQYNIKFTDSSKSVEIVKWCDINHPTASFLKHNFYPHPSRFGIYLAKLDDLAMKEISNWTWNTNKDWRGCSITACLSMMEEAFGHGPLFYNELRNKVISYWRTHGECVTIPTWLEMDFRIFG